MALLGGARPAGRELAFTASLEFLEKGPQRAQEAADKGRGIRHTQAKRPATPRRISSLQNAVGQAFSLPRPFSAAS